MKSIRQRLCANHNKSPAALTLAVLMAYGGPVSYVSAWLRRARQTDDRVLRHYVSLFLLDLMSEHGQVFNADRRPSMPDARAELRRAFEQNPAFVRR